MDEHVRVVNPGESEVDWPTLWAAFAEAPEWDELDAGSRGYFKALWFAQALPVMTAIVQSVETYDHYQKAKRN